MLVRLATDTANDELVALKIMLKEWIWKNDMSSLVRREIAIMKELDHPCVVKLVEVFNSETHVFMAMETIEGRELRTELRREGYLSEERSRNIFQQLMTAVRYLHSIGVAHRNIKLENVLLSEDGERIKLTDFELATHLDEWEGGSFQDGRKSWRTKKSHRRQQSTGRTAAYAAPEVIAATEDHRYDARGVDTWCAGLCLFALVTGRLPFRAKGSEATLGIIQTMEPTYPEGLPPLLTDLLRGMLRKDSSKRLSVPAVIGHPWTSARLNTCVDLEEQTHLARVAVQEAKLAALEAERKAAFALAAQNSAALALAAAGEASSAVEPPPAAAAAAQGEEDKHDRRGIPRSRSGSGNRSLSGQAGGPAVASKAPGKEEAGAVAAAAVAARTSGSSSSAYLGGGRNSARLLRRRASMEETGGGGGGGGKPPAPEKQARPSSQRDRGGGTRGGGGGPAIQRPVSVDYRRDDVTLGPRQDNEWMTPPRDSSYPAVDSSLGRPEPAGGESGVAAGGGAGGECGRGPVVAGSVFAGTAESAAAATATGSAAVARRKVLRRSQSAVPSKGPVTNGTRGAAAETAAAAAAAVAQEAVGKGPSSSSSSSSTSAAASLLVKQGSRSGIGKRGRSIRSKIRRSLSSVFGPTSSTSSSPPPDSAPVPVPLPPSIEHSTSLDSVLAPGAAKTPRAGASGGMSAIPPAIDRFVSFDLVVPAASKSTAAAAAAAAATAAAAGASGRASAVPPAIDRGVSFDLVVPAASTSTAAAAAAPTSASFSTGAVSTPPPSQQPRADEKYRNAGAADGQVAAIPEAVTVAKKEEVAQQQPSDLSRFLASTQREKKKMARSVTPEHEPETPVTAAATVVTGDGGRGSVGGPADGLLPGERRQERPRSSSLTRAPESDPTQVATHLAASMASSSLQQQQQQDAATEQSASPDLVDGMVSAFVARSFKKSPPAGGARAVSGAVAEASVSAEEAAAAVAAEGGPWGENGAPGKMGGLDVSAGAPAAGTPGDHAATDTASAGSNPSHSVTAAAAAAVRAVIDVSAFVDDSVPAPPAAAAAAVAVAAVVDTSALADDGDATAASDFDMQTSAKTRPLPGPQEGVRPAAGAPAATESLGEDKANSEGQRWARRIVATSPAPEAEQPTAPQEVTAEDSQQAVPLAGESGLMSEPQDVGAATDAAPVSESAGANTPLVADEASSAMASLLEDGYPPGLPGAPAGPGALPIVLEGSACETTPPALGAHVADGSPPQLAGGSFSSAAHRSVPANNPKASYLRSDSEASEATSAYEDPANEFDEMTRAVLARVDGFSACETTPPALGAHVADGSPPQLAGGSFSSAAHRSVPANNPKASYLRSGSEVSEATSAYEDPANEFDEMTRAVLARVDGLEERDEPAGLTSAAAVEVALPSPDGERPLAGLSILSRMGGTAAAVEEEAEKPAGQGLPVDLPPTTPDGEETLAGLSILYSDEKMKLAAAAAAAAGAIDGVSALDDNDVTASEESKAGEETPAVEKKPAAAAAAVAAAAAAAAAEAEAEAEAGAKAEAKAASTDPVLEARSGGAEAMPDRRLLCWDGAQEEEAPSTAVDGEGPVSGTEKMEEEGGTAAEDLAGVPFASGGVVDTPLGNEDPGTLDEGAPADDASVAESRQTDTDSPVEASSDKDHPQLKKWNSLPSYDEVVSYSGSWEEDGDTAVEVTDSDGQEEGGREGVGGGGGGDYEGGDGEGCADNQQEVTGPELDDGGGDGSSREKLAKTGAGAETGEEGSIAADRDDVSVSTSTTATARSTSVQREATASSDDVPHTPTTAATRAAATAVRVAPARRERPAKRRQQPARAAGTRRSSPSREAAMPWEPIDPTGGPTAVRITGSSQPSPSPVAPGRVGGGSGGSGGRGVVTPQGFQPSTFEEMMTGVRDMSTAEKEFGSAAWDSPSQSRADGDGGGGEEEEEEAAAPRHGGGIVVQYKRGSSNAVTVRKMAELESIWGSAGASAEDDGNDWRRASGRYRRINGEYRPPKAAASNTTTTTKATTNALYGGAGGPLGQPAWSLDGTADKAATMAAALSDAGEDSKGARAPGKRQQKRGKSVGKKIYRMFGRKTEAK
ncbi:unnamed protein product [Ectocarpus sp. CCAP 1310/34]|nr:unnamed protein product [Ectocarpus sp. CCAP 1310/34]